MSKNTINKLHYNINKKTVYKQSSKNLKLNDLKLGDNSNDNQFLNLRLHSKLIINIINTRILDLLKVISAKYPDKFLKKTINAEYVKIIQKIETNDKPIVEIQRKSNEAKSNEAKSKEIAKKQKSKSGLKVVIVKEERCVARIWDNIYDRVANKEISSIDAKLKVTDYNDIDIKKFAEKYIIGRQCARKKKTGMIYCYQHCRHNPHGNYLETPSMELCYHYLIDGHYI
jgi:hypothetical protein